MKEFSIYESGLSKFYRRRMGDRVMNIDKEGMRTSLSGIF